MKPAEKDDALLLQGVKKSFGAAEIIRGVDLQVGNGSFHAVIGPNGAGKSTLFNLISGRYATTAGQILLHGKSIAGKRPYQINRAGLARSFQITHIFKALSVFENIRCALMWSSGQRYVFWRRASACRELNERAEHVMDELLLTHRRDDLAANLPYAEQRALEVGMTIAGGAKVLLLDEPMAGMNHNEVTNFCEFLRGIAKGRTVLMVEHDMEVVFRLADRISVLVYGQMIATGTVDQIRANKAVQEAYLGTSV